MSKDEQQLPGARWVCRGCEAQSCRGKLSITVACFVALVTEQMMTQQETEASRIQEVEVF